MASNSTVVSGGKRLDKKANGQRANYPWPEGFSLDSQPPLMVDEDDQRVLGLLDLDHFNQKSPYSAPGYQPVHLELSHAPIRISGHLPEDLEGVYLRNGTNLQFARPTIRIHAFAGAGMIHQIQIKQGQATYSNFYVRTPRFEFERKIGREIFPEFTDFAGAGKAALEKIKVLEKKTKKGMIPELTQYELTPGSTSIRHHNGRLYCLQETGHAFVLRAQRGSDGRLMLDGRGKLETWNGEWEGPFSAHPRFDPSNGDMYNLSVGPQKTLLVGKIVRGSCESQTSYDLGSGNSPMSWLHDFFLTKNYLIFPDISMRQDVTGLSSESGSVFKFNPDYPMRWGVVPREAKPGTPIQFFTTAKASSIWHVINAWEQKSPEGSNQVVLFSPCFDSYPADSPIHTPEEPHATVKTWTLDLDSGKVVHEETLLDHHYERPTVNLDYVGSASRFSYLLNEQGDGYMGKGVLKYDLIDKKEVGYFDYGDLYGGEALFVPKPNAKTEDDGYLLDILMSGERSELIVIDALNMVELARLHLPQRVPFGVHAAWLEQHEVNNPEVV